MPSESCGSELVAPIALSTGYLQSADAELGKPEENLWHIEGSLDGKIPRVMTSARIGRKWGHSPASKWLSSKALWTVV